MRPLLSFESEFGFSGRSWIPALFGAFKVTFPTLIISVLLLLADASKLLNPKATWFSTLAPEFPIIVPALVTFILATTPILLYFESVFTPPPP